MAGLCSSTPLALLAAAATCRLALGVVIPTAAGWSAGPQARNKSESQAGPSGGAKNVSQAARPYTALGYMPRSLGEVAFPRYPWKTLALLDQTTGSPIAAFNPSLVRLPDSGKELHPRAVYAAAVRLGGGQCERLASGKLASRKSGNGTALLILDGNLTVLLSVPITNLNGSESDGEDVKLLRSNDIVWASYMTYYGPKENRHSLWHMQPLRLHREATGEVHARYGSNHVTYTDERNMGVFGEEGHNMGIVWWLGDEVNSSTVRTSNLFNKPEIGVLHQSHHPLELAELGLFLAVVHEHLDSGNGTCKGCTPAGVPLYGYKYLSKFVLFEAADPHRIQSISPSFCFPSDSGDDCETIQLVCSLVRDGADLLVSYGVNDCEARVLRIPLAEVLKLANSTFVPPGAPPAKLPGKRSL